jgi:serine/threonine-protein kinase
MARHPLSRSLCKLQAGLRFDVDGRRYLLGGTIGTGAVGIVRKAKDLQSGRIVAVKFLAPDPKYIAPEAFDDVAERFRREGQRGTGLRHEHLVEILAYSDNAAGECFPSARIVNPILVMEYVRGATLESLIRHLNPRAEMQIHITPQTLAIAAMICRALLHLHERKIIHRDVKPANIFVSTSVPGAVPRTLRVGDFGVAKWGDFLAAVTTGTLTMTSQQGLGTLKYMSPEQAVRPKDVSVRADIFSLGITLYELFTGSILLSPHHVYEVVSARNMRASISGKLFALQLPRMTPFDEGIFEVVLEMFSGPTHRPTSKQLAPRFETWLEWLEGQS